MMDTNVSAGVNMVPVAINGEFDIMLPKHRADRPEWYTEKGWERKRLDSMCANITKNDVVFYVGSEEGEMPALCQMWGAKVVMFEPNDRVWPNPRVIWEANNLEPPLGCFSGFASDKTIGETKFIMNGFPDSAQGEVIGNHGFKELWQPGDISQIKIDDLVEQTGIIPTAFSVDVEGSEWQVLRGAENTILEHKPKLWMSIHPEFMYRMFGEYQADLRKWIKDRGYEEELLEYDHEIHLFYKPI